MNLQSFTLLQIELRRTLVYTYCRTVQWALRIVLQARSAGRDSFATRRAADGESISSLYVLRHHTQLSAAGATALHR